MNWLELSVEVDPEAVEAVSELFTRFGYNGGVVVEQPLGITGDEPGNWESVSQAWIDVSRPVTVSTYLSNDAQAPETQKQIEESLWHLAQMRQVGPLRVQERDEEDWANAWRTFYVTLRIGKRTVIKPSWLEFTPKEGDIVVDLDPGMAFGTGYHPTTALCLEALENYVQPDTNILDLGTGSGILAIAAAKLGGPGVRIFAVDTDVVAVAATRENVARNGLDGQITVEQGSTALAADFGPYNLIVANLLAAIIIDLAKSLHDLLEPGGTLISSGIFHERGDNVIAALEKAGLPVREKRAGGRLALSDFRSGAIGSAAWLAGLPWRLKLGRGGSLPPSDPRLKRVVVIKPCCMGDVLMSTPVIAALRKALPNSYIALTVAPYSRPAVQNNPRLSGLIDSPVGGENTILADYVRLARFIRRGRFGAALVLDRSPLLNMVPYLAGVPVRAGLDSDNRGLALTHPVPCPSKNARHEVSWYLDVVRALGLLAPKQDAYLEFYPTEEERAEVDRALAQVEEPGEGGCVAIHVGGGVNPGMRLLSKRWLPERWARIADWLVETYEPTVLLLGGPGKEDRETAARLKEVLFPNTQPYVVDLVGKLSWGALGAAIQRCNLFLGNDTGAMHLATAVRTPVVAVFGPSDPVRFGPWDPSERSVVVQNPKSKIQNPNSDADSLRRASGRGELYNRDVTVEEVWAAVEKVYSRVFD